MREKMNFKLTVKGLLCFIFLSFICFYVTCAYADVVIIANKSVKEDRKSKDDIKNIFLGKIVKWEDGTKINIAVLKKENELHKTFAKDYTQKTTSQFEKWWRQMVFTGKGTLPKTFESQETLVEYVKENGGAIGYVDNADITGEIKIIAVDQ